MSPVLWRLHCVVEERLFKCSAWNILSSTSTDGAAKREWICICCLGCEGNQVDDDSLPL